MKTPDHARAFAAAADVYRRFDVPSVPVDLHRLIAQVHNLHAYAYTEYCFWHGLALHELSAALGSRLGALASHGNHHIIFYNDLEENQALVRFTIAHELGHYFLNHFQDSSAAHSLKVDDAWELEANCFARNLLCPLPLLRRCVGAAPGQLLRDARTLSQIFGIGFAAAKNRLSCVAIDSRLERSTDTGIIDAITFDAITFARQQLCPQCHTAQRVDRPSCGHCGASLAAGRVLWSPEA